MQRPSRSRSLIFLVFLASAGCYSTAATRRTGQHGFSPSAPIKVLLVDLEVRGGESSLAEREELLIAAEVPSAIPGGQVVRQRDVFAATADEKEERLFRGQSLEDLRATGRRMGADWVVGGWLGRGGWAAKDPSGPWLCDLWALSVTSGRVERRAACAQRRGPPDFDGAVRTAAARLLAKDPEVSGPPAVADLVRLLNARRGHLDHCYAELLLGSGKAQGRMVLRLAVDGETGQARSVLVQGSTVGDATLDKCLVAEARELPFPRGVGAELDYPLVLVPID